MGDALATYFEARACEISNASSCAAGTSTMAAQTLAKLCYETLISEGYEAKLAAAHAIHNGLTVLPECHL